MDSIHSLIYKARQLICFSSLTPRLCFKPTLCKTEGTHVSDHPMFAVVYFPISRNLIWCARKENVL